MRNTNQSIGERSFLDLGKPSTDKEVAQKMPKTFFERCHATMMFGLFWTVVSWVIVALAVITDLSQMGHPDQGSSWMLLISVLEIFAIIPALTGLVAFIYVILFHQHVKRAEIEAWRRAGLYREDVPGETPLVDLSKLSRVSGRRAREVAMYCANRK